MVSSGRALDLGDPCTPMAWQQRDINYHQNGYQDRYGPGAGAGGGSSRVGPPSTSDRVSHRTDKSWRTHRDSRDSGHSGQPHLVPYGGSGQYPPGPPPNHYPPSRPSYSSGRAASRPHTPTTTSSSSTSSSGEESEQVLGPGVGGPVPPLPHPLYGYTGYYPGYPPPGPPPGHPGYPGTLKSARSVPALALATWDGEPCPIHGGTPPGPPGYPPMVPGPMSLPHPPHPIPTRRVNSIYDVRLGSPPPAAIYGTLPGRSLPADRRSLAGSAVTAGIPTHLLPPMARPVPLVVDEKGNPEPLPVRQTGDKATSLPPDVVAKVAASVVMEGKEGRQVCWRGGPCVAWIILALVCLGVMLAVMLRFIL